MRFLRPTLLLLPLALGSPLLIGACAAPVAVTAATYGADGVSVAETGKTGADHLASMVSKKDCALWRTFRNEDICRARDDDHDPYDVNYTDPFRQAGEGGVEYSPPPHAAPDAPAASWNAATYATPSASTVPASAAVVAANQPPPEAASTISPSRANAAPVPFKAKKHVARHSTVKRKPVKQKHSPDRAATSL